MKKGLFFFLYASFILISLISESSYTATHGLQISYGTGDPDHLKGYRVAVQQFWPWIGFSKSPLNLTGYWDVSYANWHTYPPLSGQPRSIDLGIGASWLSNNHLGHRNLGGQFAFQDLMGLGLRWRISETAVSTLSYHYLHSSNASLLPRIQCIDVKHLFTLGYEF